jgi:hypothetical protein
VLLAPADILVSRAYQKVDLSANPHMPTRNLDAVRAVNSFCPRRVIQHAPVNCDGDCESVMRLIGMSFMWLVAPGE